MPGYAKFIEEFVIANFGEDIGNVRIKAESRMNS